MNMNHRSFYYIYIQCDTHDKNEQWIFLGLIRNIKHPQLTLSFRQFNQVRYLQLIELIPISSSSSSSKLL
jgi:hypothetical protein